MYHHALFRGVSATEYNVCSIAIATVDENTAPVSNCGLGIFIYPVIK